MGTWTLNIGILNTLEYQKQNKNCVNFPMFQKQDSHHSVWFSNCQDHWKTKLWACLDHFIYKHNFSLQIKWSRLTTYWFSNGLDHWKTEQNGDHFVNHWKTEETATIWFPECVLYSNPHCTKSSMDVTPWLGLTSAIQLLYYKNMAFFGVQFIFVWWNHI